MDENSAILFAGSVGAVALGVAFLFRRVRCRAPAGAPRPVWVLMDMVDQWLVRYGGVFAALLLPMGLVLIWATLAGGLTGVHLFALVLGFCVICLWQLR